MPIYDVEDVFAYSPRMRDCLVHLTQLSMLYNIWHRNPEVICKARQGEGKHAC